METKYLFYKGNVAVVSFWRVPIRRGESGTYNNIIVGLIKML